MKEKFNIKSLRLTEMKLKISENTKEVWKMQGKFQNSISVRFLNINSKCSELFWNIFKYPKESQEHKHWQLFSNFSARCYDETGYSNQRRLLLVAEPVSRSQPLLLPAENTIGTCYVKTYLVGKPYSWLGLWNAIRLRCNCSKLMAMTWSGVHLESPIVEAVVTSMPPSHTFGSRVVNGRSHVRYPFFEPFSYLLVKSLNSCNLQCGVGGNLLKPRSFQILGNHL